MYSYADLKLKIDYSKDENIAFAVSENNIFAFISTAEQGEENEEISYTYKLKIYDTSGNVRSVCDFVIDDSLLSDCLYKGVRSLSYAGENRLIFVHIAQIWQSHKKSLDFLHQVCYTKDTKRKE